MMSGPIVSGTIDTQVRFESMRSHAPKMQVFHRPANHNRVFRRHLDLDRECQRKVKMYAKEARLMTNKIARYQREVLDKQKELEILDQEPAGPPTVPHANNKHQIVVPLPKLHKEKKDTLLFRVRHVAGKKVYIRETEKQPNIAVRLKV